MILTVLAGCTILTSPGDYEGGDAGMPPIPCDGDGDCPTGVCETDRGECVECLMDTDCAVGQSCELNRCIEGMVDCGDAPCPPTQPFCLMEGDTERCVACLLPSDCGDGETCTSAFECSACAPAVACTATEVCISGDGGGDTCLDCDRDGDGELSRDPRCGALVGVRDCDDDGDGFCHPDSECAGECAEAGGDCDDADAERTPTLVACGATRTVCFEEAGTLPGSGVASATLIRLTDLEAPSQPEVRAPISVVAERGASLGVFQAVYLTGVTSEGFAERARAEVDGGDRSSTSGVLPASQAVAFRDLRVSLDDDGLLIGTLGQDPTDAPIVEITTLPSFADAPTTSESQPAPNVVRPIDVGLEIVAAGTMVPYVTYVEQFAGDSTVRVFSGASSFMQTGAFPAPSTPVLSTMRGLVGYGALSAMSMTYWNPRNLASNSEPKGAGGRFRMDAATDLLFYDVRQGADSTTVRRNVLLAGGSYSASDEAVVAGLDTDAHFALDVTRGAEAYIAYDAPTFGGRAIHLVRAGGVAGAPAVGPELEVVGPAQSSPVFESVFGIEMAVRAGTDATEVGILIHGQLAGESSPGLYLAIVRRCDS